MIPTFFIFTQGHKKSSLNFKELFVGLLGLEPRTTEPKSAVLPLHHRPVPRCFSKVNYFCNADAKLALFLYIPKKNQRIIPQPIHHLLQFINNQSKAR